MTIKSTHTYYLPLSLLRGNTKLWQTSTRQPFPVSLSRLSRLPFSREFLIRAGWSRKELCWILEFIIERLDIANGKGGWGTSLLWAQLFWVLMQGSWQKKGNSFSCSCFFALHHTPDRHQSWRSGYYSGCILSLVDKWSNEWYWWDEDVISNDP